MTMPVSCPVCDGVGDVVYEDGLPRPAREADRSVERIIVCPACDGTGIEPGQEDEQEPAADGQA